MNVLARNINAIIIKSIATVLERVAEEYHLDASQLTETFITDDVLVCADGSKKTPRPRAKRTVRKDTSEKKPKPRVTKQSKTTTTVSSCIQTPASQMDENGVTVPLTDHEHCSDQDQDQDQDQANHVSSSQETDEEISVEEIIVENVTYLKDEKNNLYTHDLENPKRIGILLANNKLKLLPP
jgi:hypothetical protein